MTIGIVSMILLGLSVAIFPFVFLRRDRPLEFCLPAPPTLDAAFFAEPKTQVEFSSDRPISAPLPPPALINSNFFNDTLEFGHFGEVLTSVLLSGEGWQQLPSHTPGGQGLDGIFVKAEVGGGYRVLLVETKTTGIGSKSYNPAQMADENVKKLLLKWGSWDASLVPIAEAIISALERRSQYVRKELWEHDTQIMIVNVHLLGPEGERLRRYERGTDKSMQARDDYERLARSVAITLKTYYRNNLKSVGTG